MVMRSSPEIPDSNDAVGYFHWFPSMHGTDQATWRVGALKTPWQLSESLSHDYDQNITQRNNMRGEGLFRFTVSECYSPSQQETHGTMTQPGCKEPGTTAARVVTNQEAGSGQNQGLGETNNLQRLAQPGPISWRPHSPARLYQSGKQAIKIQNVWGTIQIQTWNIDGPVRRSETTCGG